VRFWGTRGSIPTPGAQTGRYGGNTPCIEVRGSNGDALIFDAGSGVRSLGHSLIQQACGRPITAHLFLTHAHWDHIQGLPFFEPLYLASTRLTVWGPSSLLGRLERALRVQMSPEVFPVSFDTVEERLDFRELPDDGVDLHGIHVRPLPVCHPDGAVGFAVSRTGATRVSLAYVPDNELTDASAPDAEALRAELLHRVQNATLLVHDAMFTAAEADAHEGWGHSTARAALALALDACVETVALFHHHPMRSDDDVDQLVAECRDLIARSGARTTVVGAAEGMTVDL
jgi:phosphoribosyl 1,2-cyclic phosphodiesterase